MSYTELITRLTSTEFQNQCLYAVLFLMRYIRSEPVETPNHAVRLAWVKAAMASPAAMAGSMANFAITDYLCYQAVAPTDEEVKVAIENIVNIYSE